MLEMLPLKEKTAIELKYLGNPHKEIAEKIDTPVSTVDGWFASTGKLAEDYAIYVKKTNISRDKASIKGFTETDENIAKLTTNVLRQFAQQLQGIGKRYMLVDKDSKPILKDGKEQIMIYGKNLTSKDMEVAWKMQRVITGRHTDSLQVGSFDEEAVQKDIDIMADILKGIREQEEEKAKKASLEKSE